MLGILLEQHSQWSGPGSSGWISPPNRPGIRISKSSCFFHAGLFRPAVNLRLGVHNIRQNAEETILHSSRRRHSPVTQHGGLTELIRSTVPSPLHWASGGPVSCNSGCSAPRNKHPCWKLGFYGCGTSILGIEQTDETIFFMPARP